MTKRRRLEDALHILPTVKIRTRGSERREKKIASRRKIAIMMHTFLIYNVACIRVHTQMLKFRGRDARKIFSVIIIFNVYFCTAKGDRERCA